MSLLARDAAISRPAGNRRPRQAVRRPDLRRLPQDQWPAALAANLRTGLTGFLDCQILRLRPGGIEARLALRDELMLAAGDVLHAGTVVTLADSCAGWGCLATLPDGIAGFTTSELKVNLVATTRMPDALICVAQLLHGGRSTQVWDATVTRERDGRAIAHYRATQHLLTAQR
jgi:1,4-dihydroxy-2-naphthoyl-CoA hydrolase